MVDVEQAQHWNSRGHFFAAAAESMRRILVDQARRKASLKRGGNFQRIELTDVDPESKSPEVDLLALNETLDQLAEQDPRAAELVKLRFFAGLTNQQAAEVLSVSVATVENDWAYAKSWLRAAISESADTN